MLQNSTRLADLPGMGFAAKIGLGAGQPQTNVEDAARDQFTGPLKPIARSRTILRLETNPRVSRTVVRPISAPDPHAGGPRPISGFFSLQTNPRVSRTVVRPISAPDPHAGGPRPISGFFSLQTNPRVSRTVVRPISGSRPTEAEMWTPKPIPRASQTNLTTQTNLAPQTNKPRKPNSDRNTPREAETPLAKPISSDVRNQWFPTPTPMGLVPNQTELAAKEQGRAYIEHPTSSARAARSRHPTGVN